MRLQRYNLEVVYTQGKPLYLADTLSRAFLSTNQVSGPQDGLEHISMVQYLPITEQRLQQIKEYTSSDEHLQQLRAVIMDGGLQKRKIYHIRWHHTSRIEMNCQYKTALSFVASESSYRQTCDRRSKSESTHHTWVSRDVYAERGNVCSGLT